MDNLKWYIGMKRMNKYDINNEQKLNKHVALHFYCYYFIKIFLQCVYYYFLGPENINKDKVKEFYTNYVWNSLHSDNFFLSWNHKISGCFNCNFLLCCVLFLHKNKRWSYLNVFSVVIQLIKYISLDAGSTIFGNGQKLKISLSYFLPGYFSTNMTIKMQINFFC